MSDGEIGAHLSKNIQNSGTGRVQPHIFEHEFALIGNTACQ